MGVFRAHPADVEVQRSTSRDEDAVRLPIGKAAQHAGKGLPHRNHKSADGIVLDLQRNKEESGAAITRQEGRIPGAAIRDDTPHPGLGAGDRNQRIEQSSGHSFRYTAGCLQRDGKELRNRSREAVPQQRVGKARLGHYSGAATYFKPSDRLPGIGSREDADHGPRRDDDPSPSDECPPQGIQHGTMVGSDPPGR